ncbi:hypothetical protein CQW23_02923 [Capsicum baccatum]|uniref:Uncharacterized protein n=1 Tax=Capsicum baccatum TaxID=33114 RepID=A0A2G2XSW8_CAPBA|nr:hypothetical protein CQW23_02923 [Capsicum baccatum]
MINHTETYPQLPIYNDEFGNDYQFPQQIITCPMAKESTCMVLNGGNTDAVVFVSGNIDAIAFVSDQWSTCCEEQVQNLEEAEPSTFIEPTTPLVIYSDECFPMEGLFDTDDFIAEDLSWATDLFD